jgi:malate/lactate dehydrogenase
MSLVAILGAGEIGGAAARALAMRARVSAVRLIDSQPNVAAGKALDLRQANPISGSDTRIEGSTECSSAAGACAIILADTAAGAEWSGETGLALLRRLAQLGCFQQGVLIFAGSSQLSLMQMAIDELGLSRSRVVGSAPEALAATARTLVAIEARASASQVSLTVLGRPPRHVVIPWAEASVAGHSILALLTPPQINLVESRMKGLWPPGPATLGSTAAAVSEAVAVGSRRLFSAFVSLDRDNGTKAPVCAWPVMVGRSGLERVTTPALTTRDRVIMDEVLGDETE